MVGSIWLARWPLGEPCVKQLQGWLGQSEQSRYATIKSDSKRSEYLASRYLLRHALSKRFDASLSGWQITEQPKAAPRADNVPEPCFVSISHSGDMVAVALSGEPLGLDIELPRAIPHRMKMARRLFTVEQCEALLKTEEPSLFFKLWTAKEALYKAHSQLDQPIPFFSTKALDQSPFELKHFCHDGYLIALAHTDKTATWRLSVASL